MRYTYDESGVTFYYFVISLLALVLLPFTYSLLFSSGGRLPARSCSCSLCLKKAQTLHAQTSPPIKRLSKWLLVIGGWAVVGILVQVVINTPIELTIWDPYEVMQLDTEATVAQIKKQYKVLSLQYHPDKATEELRTAHEAKYIDITKAYKVLTDEETRKNYEEWGHPDGRQAYTMGIALPAWLVEGGNGNWLLAVYGIIFGIGMPFYVGRWWYRSQKYNKDRIHNRTMALYFREIHDNTNTRQLLDVLSASLEFVELWPNWSNSDEEKFTKLAESVKQAVEEKANGDRFERSKKFTSNSYRRVSCLVHAYLNRVAITDQELLFQQRQIVQKSIHLLLGMLQITLSRGWLQTSLLIMELSQYIVQACTHNDNPLLQLPFVTQDTLVDCRYKKKAIRSVRQLLEIPSGERRELFTSLSDADYNTLLKVANLHPYLDVPQATFKVIGDTVITPGSIVTLLVKLRCRPTSKVCLPDSKKPSSEEDEDPNLGPLGDEEADRLMLKSEEELAGGVQAGYVHAPLFPMHKRPYWWVVFGDLRQNGLVTSPEKLTGLVNESMVKFQFQAPPRPGVFNFTIFVKSDSYLGLDIKKDVKLVVQDGKGIINEEVYEDEISEPDEDSLAGQMAAMKRGGQPAPARGKPGASAGGASTGGGGGKKVARDSDTSDDE